MLVPQKTKAVGPKTKKNKLFDLTALRERKSDPAEDREIPVYYWTPVALGLAQSMNEELLRALQVIRHLFIKNI